MAEKITLYDVDINFEQAVKDTQELKQKTEELKNIADSYKGTVEENSAAHIKAQAAYKASTAELRSQETILVKLTAANDTQAGTLKKLEAANAKLRLEQKGLNLETEEGITRNKQITEQINKNTDAIKANSDKRIQDIMNVGNYKSALDGVSQTMSVMPGKAGQVASGFQTMSTALKAFIANPIGAVITAIVVAVTGLVAIFKKFEPVLEWIEQKIAAVTAVFNVLKDAFVSFISGTKSLKDSFSGLGQAMKEAASEAQALKKAQQELEDKQILMIETEKRTKRQIDELLLQSKDRTKSEKERIALIDEALKVEEAAHNTKKKLIDDEYSQKVRQIAINNQLTEEQEKNLQDQGTAYLQLLQQTKAINDDEVKEFAELSAARETILNESIMIREKAINRQNVLIEKQAEAEAKAIELKAKAEAEAENERIKAEQKRVEEAKKALEETIKNLGFEIEAYKLLNQTKIDEQNLLTPQLIEAEMVRLEAINELEVGMLQTQYDNKLISQEEFNLKKLALDNNLLVASTELTDTYNEEQQAIRDERAALEYENTVAVLEGTLFGELELKRKVLAQEEAQEIAYAEKIGASTLNIEKKYNKAKRQLAISEFNAKMTIAQQLTNNLAQIAGEQTAIGKAAAVTSATISTIQGGVSALTGMIETIPGPVGIVLGAVAAAAVLASGYLQVKEILSVKSGLPGDGGVSASIPSASMPSIGGDTQAAIRSTVNPEIGQGIVSRETNDTASQSVSNGVSQALQENPMQPTLVTDEVTVNQSTQMAQSKTATI